MKYIRVILIGYYWLRIIFHVSHGNCHKSWKLYQKFEKYVLPDDEEAQLIKGFILSALERDDESITVLKKALELVQKSTSLNADERIYLTNYASHIAVTMNLFENPFIFNDNYEEKDIAHHLRENFPYVKNSR